MRSFFRGQRERGRKDITLRQYRAELNKFFLFLGYSGVLSGNQALLDRIRYHSVPVEIDIVSLEELTGVIRQPLFAVAYFSGRH